MPENQAILEERGKRKGSEFWQGGMAPASSRARHRPPGPPAAQGPVRFLLQSTQGEFGLCHWPRKGS